MRDDQPRKLLALQELADTLETFVDDHGIARVAEALALVCSAKSDHVRQYTDSEALSDAWGEMAIPFLMAEAQAERTIPA